MTPDEERITAIEARVRDTFAHVEMRFDTGIETLLTGSWRRNTGQKPARSQWCRTDRGIAPNAGQTRQLDKRERAVVRSVGDIARWREVIRKANIRLE